MNEPAINSRSRDPACASDGPIINNFNNSMKKPKKSNSIFIHKISNLMETKYDVKRLLRTGTLLALLFAWMLTGSFVANSQIAPKAGPWTVDLTIVGGGKVDVTGYPNTIVGPVTSSLIGPFADGSQLYFTATALPGYKFTGWSAPIGTDVTPSEYVIYGNITLTATFKKVILLSDITFAAADKVFDGNTAANLPTATIDPLALIDPLDDVTVNFVSASFADANAASGKTVTFTGVALGGLHAGKYHLAGTTGTATAAITKQGLIVVGATADSKVYNGNTTATVNFGAAVLATAPLGYMSPNVSLVTTGYAATFDTKNVGIAKTVSVSNLSLGGSDAGNYLLAQPTLSADITKKFVTFNVNVPNKTYDGTTNATISSISVKPADLVVGETVNVSFAGYVANFVNALVENGKTVNITAGIALTGGAAGNYDFSYPIVATGNIIAPIYAMFTPTYEIGRAINPVAMVPFNTLLSVQFSESVYASNGTSLNGKNSGDIVRLEKWDGGSYVLVATTGSVIANNKATITPVTPLEFSGQYRIRFAEVYTSGGAATGSPVIYTCDYNTPTSNFNPGLAGSLVVGNEVIFQVQSEANFILPVVTPYGGGQPVCNNIIEVSFINPLKYVDNTPIGFNVDNAKHKFALETFVGGVWTPISTNDWTVTYSLVGAGAKFTFAFNNGTFEYNRQYRIRMTLGLDGALGFLDTVYNLPVLDNATASSHTQGNDGWWWSTVAEYPVKAYVNYTTVSTEFGTRPNNLSNVTFNGGAVISYGIAPAYPLTVNNDFTADVTDLPYVVASTNGEGYHVANWSRSTNGGSSWTVLPTTAPLVSPVEGQNWAPIPDFNFNPNTLKPTSCAQSLAYRANFDINKYNVDVTVTGPVGSGTVAPTNANLTNLNHGTTVTLTATPAAGFYFVGWNYVGLPGTPVETVPNHTLVGYPATGANGTLSFQLVGPLSDGTTFDVEAVFAAWEPRVYAATDPQNAFTGLINATVQFGYPARTGFGQEGAPFTGLDFDWESYVYNTPVKLEALGADCRYEFVKWQKWNPAILPAGGWVDYPQLNPTSFIDITENLRLKAVYKLIENVNITATSKEAANASVVVYYDAARTVPKVINGVPVNGGSTSYTYGTTLYITVFPEPEMKTWRWENAAGLLNTNVDFDGSEVDRTYWIYEVGSEPNCGGVDLKAVVELKEYEVTLETDNRTIGTINQSTPVAENGGNSSYPAQSELGFAFSNTPSPGTTQTGFGYFTIGTPVTMKATVVNPLYRFKHWEILGAPVPTVYTEDAEFTINSISSDYGFEAVFELIPVPVPTYLLTVNVDGMGTTSMETGEITAGVHTISATPAPGYYFVDWDASANLNVLAADLDNNPLTFTMPAEGATLTANFAKISYSVNPVVRTYLHPTASFSVVNYGGEFAPAGIQGPFEAGETVTITAMELPGWTFINWIDGDVDPLNTNILTGVQYTDDATIEFVVPATNDNAASVVIDIYAIFIEEHLPAYPTYELTTATDPDGFGTVTGAGTYAHGIVVPVTQTPEPGTGYYFSGWDGNVVAGHVNMINGDEHVIAEYTPITYTLQVFSNDANFGLIEINDNGEAVLDTEPFTVNDLPIMVTAITEGQDCWNEYMFDGWYIDAAHTIRLKDAGGNDVLTESFNFIPFAHTANVFEIYAKFSAEAREYDVTAIANPVEGGTPSIDVAGPYYCGDPLIITTVDNVNGGYEFQHWTKDGVLFIEQRTFNYNVEEGGAEFVAVYEAIEFTVTATATAGGTVDPASQVKTIGQDVEVLAIANTGFEFTSWTDPDDVLADATANPATFNMPADDVSLVAQFTAIDYTVTATAGAGGTVAPATQTVNYQDAITVTATPNDGFVFDGWTATGVTLANAMTNPASFTMPANDVALVADFAKIPYTVTASVMPSNGGTTSALNANYFVGDAVSVTATANPGFEFTSWTATGVTLATPTAATQNFTMPAGNVTLVANFSPVNNKLMGHVKYFNQFESGLPLSAGIQVALLNSSDVVVGGPVAVGMDGYYEFTNIVPGTSYKVKVWESGATLANTWSWNNWGGASAADALVISYMAAGNNVVNNFPWVAPVSAPNYTPFAVEVADVDNNGIFTGNDPLIVMRRSIGLPGYSPFPIGGTPNFQVAGGEVASLGAKVYPQAPSVVFAPMGTYAAGTAGTAFYYVGTITGKAGNTVMNLYYIAGGDVNASYVPQGGAKAQPSLSYNGVINANVGDVVSIPVAIDQAVTFNALNMGLSFDNNMIEVLSVNGYDVVNIDNNNGNVNIAWFDAAGRSASTATIVVNARILSDIDAADRLFELNGLNEISDTNAQAIEGVSFTASSINTNATNINEVSDLTAISYPNPFNSEATISYTMPEAGKVNVIVYNKLGQVVKVLVNEVQNAGAQTVRLSSADLNGNGTYLYKVIVEGSAKSYAVNGTLILVK